jgi:chaperonin GroEL
MRTEVRPYTGNEEKVLTAVATLADPVVQTLSPRGGNVMLPLPDGRLVVSNDGITIARAISSEDEFENNIIRMMKEACVRTNTEAGDGTTTSILLASTLVREGMKYRRDGMNPIELIDGIRKGGEKIQQRITKFVKKIRGNKDLQHVAYISANNNDEVAERVVETLDVVGLDGMVFIDVNKKPHDELVKDVGYIVRAGMLRPEMQAGDGRGMVVSYENVPVLVTDKRLYYREEAETILRAVYQGGWDTIVIVARDFIGEFTNVMLANHKPLGGKFNILLVKDPNATDAGAETLEDLACYLEGEVVSEKTGKLVDQLTPEQLRIANRVFADGTKTVILKEDNKANPRLSMRVSNLRAELEKDKENEKIKERIGSLTTGMVKILVGAPTMAELQERIYRYEDAVSATRAAMRSGYVAGGGVTLMNCYNEDDYDGVFKSLFRKFTEASIRQIAKNCGKDPDTVVENVKGLQEDMEDPEIAMNAKTGDYQNMREAGIIDPAEVLRLTVENSISAATNILSCNYFVTNIKEDGKDSKDSRRN